MSRSKVLSLYRALLREARQMPTENRRQFVKLKSRQEFRSAAALSDPQAIEFSIALAETQLDNVTRQRQLLNELRDEGNLKGPK